LANAYVEGDTGLCETTVVGLEGLVGWTSAYTGFARMNKISEIMNLIFIMYSLKCSYYYKALLKFRNIVNALAA
jgi:hypothetical protein